MENLKFYAISALAAIGIGRFEWNNSLPYGYDINSPGDQSGLASMVATIETHANS